jgi:hypothetical protein
MHILDLIMYIILIPIIWKLIEVMSNEEFTQEMGTIVGVFIMSIFTIIYVILFWFCDYNWIDIFQSIKDSTIRWYSNLRL